MPKKLTPDEYREIFLKKYPDYELLSDYNGNKNYITVKCKKDGYVWNTKPNWLNSGAGCQKCYDRRRGETTKIGRDEFIRRAREIHGDKYDYSKVDYKSNKDKVTIICPKHGEFQQKPNKHISRKDGCPKCANKYVTNDEFIEKAKKIHGDKYDYSKVNYVNNTTPIEIICKKHGSFWQTPDKHLQRHGCPICKESRLERDLRVYLTDNGIKFEIQKKFKWLGTQSLDFYLPDSNIGIECQGIQHLKDFSLKNNKRFDFDVISNRDIKKNLLCKENGVNLYYILCDNIDSIDSKVSHLYNDNNVITKNDIFKVIKKPKTLFSEIFEEIRTELQ